MLSEQSIRKAIEKNYPKHQILGEEEGFDPQNTEFTWVIDPLDGTTNFASGVPLFAVSIGLFKKRKPILGVIYDPTRNDCYWAIDGEPAYKNGIPIKVSKRSITSSTVTAFGSLWDKPKDRQIPIRIIRKTKGRNLGSCVLHLTSVASGQMEFAIMEKIKLWDLASRWIYSPSGGRTSDRFRRKANFSPFQILCSLCSFQY